MLRSFLAAVLFCAGACSTGSAGETGPGGRLHWSALPPLPPAPGQARQIGLAGPFVGVHNDVPIVAGGANFPDALPWRGGKKVWWPDAFALVRGPDGKRSWRTDAGWRLPRALAYGAAVSTADGVVCIGGCDANRCYADAFRLSWNGRGLTATDLPPLPRPLAFLGAARIGNVVYVAGGQETTDDARATGRFYALDLARVGDANAAAWEELPPLPGPPRVLPVVAAQNDGETSCVYVFSGRNVHPGGPTELLTDAYRYDPTARRWHRLADVAPAGEPPRCVMGAPVVASGAHHVLVFGGADGKLFAKLEALGKALAAATDEAEKARLTAEKNGILDNHPGFSRDVLAYHTVTDTWTRAGEMPPGSPVTTIAAPWGEGFVVPTGEVRPGVRSAAVWRVAPRADRRFGWVNYAVLGAYLAALVAMGVYFSRREKTTDDFFKAGRRIPWWAAGLSIFGTQLSAITFMAIPAKTYATDWRRFMGNVCILLIAPLIVFVFLPFFRRLNVTTAYEYLERRFNLASRLIGSAMFVLFQFGRIGIVLFLPSIALSVVTGFDVRACIAVMGVLSIVYTVLGGIEAVIWTDVLQVIVLVGGALLCLVLIAASVPGGAGGLVSTALADAKLHTFDFTPDLAESTFWVVVLGGLAAALISYGSDQAVIQRYLTTKDERAAARSIWVNGVLSVVATLLFFSMGAALYGFYKARPDLLSPTLGNPDAIFPWYIVTQLPAGVAGLLIAGLFAAAMSSLDSSMNSVATAVTTDFFRRFRPGAADRTCLNVARWATVIVGVAGTAFALLMTGWDIKSLWDEFVTVLGLFSGGLAGLYLLGILSRRAHGRGAVIGLLLSGAAPFLVQRYTRASFLLYGLAGIVASVVLGYLASRIVPARDKPLAGLTLYTLGKEQPQ